MAKASTSKKLTKPSIKKKANKKSPEEIKQDADKRKQVRPVRAVFNNTGFSNISSVRDKEFTFEGQTSDFDDCFILENVLILCEYTITNDVSSHLKNKQGIYNLISTKKNDFVQFMRQKFPDIQTALSARYSDAKVQLIILYCSNDVVKDEHRALVKGVSFFDSNIARYFDTVASATYRSAKHELLDYLRVPGKNFGERILSRSSSLSRSIPCSVLPEDHSNFGSGFKIVSFYCDPQTLLERAYVLRKQGWRAGDTVYQRMISKKKVQEIRRYLLSERRVFINNIIATLPETTKLVDGEGDTIDTSTINDTEPGVLQLPIEFNSIGLIDGQHRVFSYHEGGAEDDEISLMRQQQNLLVTGLIFPPGMTDIQKLKFEAQLFLEINSNQSKATSELKQDVTALLKPFAPESIARRVLHRLNDERGPLQHQFQRFFYESDKVKTSSVVTFALKPLVSPSSAGMFNVWNHPDKAEVTQARSEDALEDYIAYCVKSLNDIFAGIRKEVPNSAWTAKRSPPGNFLTTRNISAVILALRDLVRERDPLTISEYLEAFDGIDFQTMSHGSSEYRQMGAEIFRDYLSVYV